MQIVNGKCRDHENYIVRIVKPLPIHWYIDLDCNSFSFDTVDQNVNPFSYFFVYSKKDRRNHHVILSKET